MGEIKGKIGHIFIQYHEVSELQMILNVRRIMSEWYSSSKDITALKRIFSNRIETSGNFDHAFFLNDIIENDKLIGVQIYWIDPVSTMSEPVVTIEDIELKKYDFDSNNEN